MPHVEDENLFHCPKEALTMDQNNPMCTIQLKGPYQIRGFKGGDS